MAIATPAAADMEAALTEPRVAALQCALSHWQVVVSPLSTHELVDPEVQPRR